MAIDPKLLESDKDTTRPPTAKHLQTGVMELIDRYWREMVQNLQTCYEEWLPKSGEEFPTSDDWAEFKLRSFVETMRKEHGMDADKIIGLLQSLSPMKSVAHERTDTEKRRAEPDACVEPERIRPGPYLRAMCTIAWHSFRHPMSTTVVDLETGKALVAEESVPPDCIATA